MEIETKGLEVVPRVSSSAVVHEDSIYFFGGFDGNSWINDTLLFDIPNSVWY